MGTLTKFKGDTLKASKDIVPQMFVWWGAQTYKLVQYSATLRDYILVSLQQIMFKLGIFTNFLSPFQPHRWIFANWSQSKDVIDVEGFIQIK